MKVGIFCSSSQSVDSKYFKEITRLSKGLVQRKFEIIYGGANEGLMKELADSTLKEGGKITGIVPKYFKNKKNLIHQKLSQLIVVENLMQRKEKFVELSHVLIAFPGGIGTIDETIDVISRRQLLEKPLRPIYIFNFLNFWSPWIQWLESLDKNNFIKMDLKKLFKVVKNLKELFSELEKYNHSLLN